MNSPLSSGDFDPLRPPGSNSSSTPPTVAMFRAGEFVRTSMDNTAFFKSRPKENADADKLLKRNTSMKVVSNSGSYVKVELDSGEVGFVPSVMLEDPNAAASAASTLPGEYQVYPPLPAGTEPLPVIDPASQPPANAIPAVIDPDAPAVETPVPALTPPTGQFEAPAVPKVESVPLPPNSEELEQMKKSGKKPKVASPKLEE